jgi:DNA helicase HerA-like ATPase
VVGRLTETLGFDRRQGGDADGPEGALASSLDGRHFEYALDLDRLALSVGAYVLVADEAGGERLGQVTGVSRVAGDARAVRVAGRMLEGDAEPFGSAEVRAPGAERVGAWLASHHGARAALDVGVLKFADDLPLELDAGGFDRHTFLCGQSGSGKTYALGTILERLLAETSLRIVVLDPNSDFVRLGECRDDADDDARDRYGKVNAAVDVRRAGGSGDERLHVRFRDFDADEQAAVLRLDPIADRLEYAALSEALEAVASGGGGEDRDAKVRDLVDGLCQAAEPRRSLGLRARNLGIDEWRVWSEGARDSLQDLVQPGGPRCVVADLGSLGGRAEQAVAAEAVLAALWRRRAAREPVLIVIDEAHNVSPAEPADRLTALATEHAVRIAGEGRKFGLVLLAATQRPQKVHENVVSQCDNLVLMRMNSRSDLSLLEQTFSFVPGPLLDLAGDFGQGEAVVAGKLVPSPTLGRFGPRWSPEGGADVPAHWAMR